MKKEDLLKKRDKKKSDKMRIEELENIIKNHKQSLDFAFSLGAAAAMLHTCKNCSLKKKNK